jgi:hypothetical protein
MVIVLLLNVMVPSNRDFKLCSISPRTKFNSVTGLTNKLIKNLIALNNEETQ